MLCLRNFRVYQPTVLTHGPGVYFQDDQGRDWYTYRERFQKDTVKVLFDEQHGNCIVAADVDHWFMVPNGLSIAELPADAIPSVFQANSTWIYHDGRVFQTLEARKESVRLVRNHLLYSTDVMLVSDYTVADCSLSAIQREELGCWRRELKKFPATAGFPDIPFVKTPEWIMKLAIHHGFKSEIFTTIAHFCAVD